MRAIVITVLASILMTGCAQQPPRKAERVDPGPPSICRTPAECSVMWSNSIDQVQRITGMKLALATDSYLQTYSNFRAPWMMGQVYKTANQDGTATIRAEFTCRHGCDELASSAERLFNTMIKPMDYNMPSLNPAAREKPATAQPAPAPRTLTKDEQLYELQQRNLPYEQYQQEYRRILGQ